ncbi:hypothetical protein ACN26Y_02480 [Micromonospora sp. WMMD558]|uniref:hypothetical protein n=1 Tax=Micromonospora sp. WMMD558 TaxID=3403462 RepID=UPI003BF5F4B1
MTRPMPASPVPAEPRPVSLISTSRAADAGFLTLADLAQITTTLDLDYRIVGGHMVTLLVALHGVSAQVPLRETADADFAALPTVIADPRLPAALIERGYRSRKTANRFTRDTDDHRWPSSPPPATLTADTRPTRCSSGVRKGLPGGGRLHSG